MTGMSTAGGRTQRHAELLRAVPGLETRSGEELARVAATIEERDLVPGEPLVEARSDRAPAFVIIDGWAAATVNGEPVAALGPGQFVGGGSLRSRDAGDATVIAKSPMRVLVIPPDRLRAALTDAGVGRDGGEV